MRPCAGNGRVSMSGGGSGEAEDRRWGLDLERFQALSGMWRGFGDLPDGAIGARQLGELDVLEIIADVAPGVLAGVLDGALQEEGEHRDGDMGMDAVGRPVKHRTHLQAALHGAPGLFDTLLLLVTQRHIFRAEGVVVAVDDELAVEALKLGDGLTVDGQSGLGLLQQPPVAGAADKRTHALGSWPSSP